MKNWGWIFTLLTVAGLVSACGSVSAAPETAANRSDSGPAPADIITYSTQSSSESSVNVDVTPVNLAEGGATLDFEVAFNTHSVNMDFDPAAISVLRDDQGREYPAIAWEGAGPGGHHRSGVLRFKVPDYATKSIEIVIHDVAGVPERVFHWDLM